MSNLIAALAIVVFTGIASSVSTFLIWEREAFNNYDRYDKALESALKKIDRLTKENSRLQATIAEQNVRLNPAQVDFFDMPTKKEYRAKSDVNFYG